jgi:DnaK suppressor protein
VEDKAMKREKLISRQSHALFRRRDELGRSRDAGQRLLAHADRVVGDSIDAAVASELEEMNTQLLTVESRELAAIETAIERLREGRYGVCEECLKPISATRLKALPHATLCVKCQRSLEQGQPRNGPTEQWGNVHDEAVPVSLHATAPFEIDTE